MHSNLFQPYRQPECVVRAVQHEDITHSELELVTHVHAPELDDMCSHEYPTMLRHTLDTELRDTASNKLTEIDVRVEFDKPEHVLRAKYVMWSQTEIKHPMCQGNGRTGVQIDPVNKTDIAVKCLGPSRCPLAQHGSNKCLVDARMGALVGGMPVEVRVNSENGLLAMYAGLKYAYAKTNGQLTRAKLKVKAWSKSTRGSNYQPFTTLTCDFAAAEEGDVLSEHMNAYGNDLLKQWEEQFPAADLDLPLPQVPGCVSAARVSTMAGSAMSRPQSEQMFPMPTKIVNVAGAPSSNDGVVLGSTKRESGGDDELILCA